MNISSKCQRIISSNSSFKKKSSDLTTILYPITRSKVAIALSSVNKKRFIDDIVQDCILLIPELIKRYVFQTSLFYTYYNTSADYLIRKNILIYQAMGTSKRDATISEKYLNNIYFLDEPENFFELESLDYKLYYSLDDLSLNEYFMNKYIEQSDVATDLYIFNLIYYDNKSDYEIMCILNLSRNVVQMARRRLKKFILKNKDIFKQFLC